MSEIRAGWHDARRTPGARLLQGRKYGDWAYSFGYAVRVAAKRALIFAAVVAAALLAIHWLSSGSDAIVNPTIQSSPH